MGSTASASVSPADGRLRGEDFAATVTGVSWPAQATSGGKTTLAPPGHRYVVFSLSLSEDTSAITPDGSDPAVTAAVQAGGASIPIDLTTIDNGVGGAQSPSGWTTGTGNFTVTVPNDTHAVSLVISQSPFSQSLNLWTLRRVPPAPFVLYRDPSGPTLTGTAAAPATLALSNPSDGFSDTATVSLQSATLSYFPPAGVNAALTSSEAVLGVVLDGEYPDNPNDLTGSGHYLGSQAPLPGSMLSFTPAGGSPVSATMSDAGDTNGKGKADDGLFDATYSFVVPATLTTGTLTVNSGPFTGTEFTLFTAESGNTTVDVSAPASLTVDFPAVPATTTQKTPPWVSQPLPPTASASGPISTTSGGGNFPIWLAVVLLAVLAAGAVLFERWLRRRRTLALVDAAPRDAESTAFAVEAAPGQSNDAPVLAENPTGAPFSSVAAADVADQAAAEDGPMALVIGPPGARGLRQEPDRRIVIEILAWMVFHNDHSHNADEILVGVYPTEGTRREVNRETFFTYLSKVRQCVGPEHLPEATTAGGYRLIGVTSDWELFEALSQRADATEGPEAIELRTEALSLVRGAPFQGVPRGHYQWAFDEHLDSQMTSRIVTCALRLANDLFDLGHYAAVDEAVQAGLRADATDPDLLELQERAAAARKEGLVHPGRELGDADEDPQGPNDDDSENPSGTDAAS